MRRLAVVAACVLTFTACSGNTDETETSAKAGATAPAVARGDSAKNDSASGMAGMDHSKMPGMGGSGTQPDTGAMAGMDHSKMPGVSPPVSRSSATTSSIDHANMPGMTRRSTGAPASSGSMAGMDHGSMPGTNRSAPAGQSPIPAMDHANTPGSSMTATSADDKIQEIVAQLTKDSVVLARIRADSVLRNRWQDPALRKLIGN